MNDVQVDSPQILSRGVWSYLTVQGIAGFEADHLTWPNCCDGRNVGMPAVVTCARLGVKHLSTVYADTYCCINAHGRFPLSLGLVLSLSEKGD
jgi:hypothetical protein